MLKEVRILLLYKYVFKHKLLIMLIVIICIIRSCLLLNINRGYTVIIDSVLSSNYESIHISSIVLFISGIFQVLTISLQSMICCFLAEKIGFDLRDTVAGGILGTQYSNVNSLSSGETLTKINNDLMCITEWIKNDLCSMVCDIILFLIVLITLFIINFELTLIIICITPISILVTTYLSKPLTNNQLQANKSFTYYNTLVKQSITSFEIIKTFRMDNWLLSKANNDINNSYTFEKTNNRTTSKIMAITGFISYMPTIVIFGIGGYMAIHDYLSAGTLLAYINLSNFIIAPLKSLPNRICSIRITASNSKRILDLLISLK